MPCTVIEDSDGENLETESEADTSKSVATSSLSSLNRDGTRSAFTPYRPTTVLTNLQRGNVQTKTAIVQERGIHQLAAQGELFFPSFVSDEKFSSIRINIEDSHGFTPLMWAARFGQIETVKKLLDYGANVTKTGLNGETALSFACSAGHVAIVKMLISHGALLDTADNDGNTALMHAVYNNHALCVHELLNAGADITILNEALESAFEIAVRKRCKNAQAIMEKHMLNILQGR